RLLRQGRGRRLRRGRQARPWWLAADQHQRRWAVLHPPRDVRHVPARRGRPPAPGRVRSPAGGGRRGRRGPRLGRGALDDGHRGARDGGDAVTTSDVQVTTTLIEPPIGPDAVPFWEATRERRLVLPWCTACDRPHWYPRAVCPACLGDSIEWRAASGVGEV